MSMSKIHKKNSLAAIPLIEEGMHSQKYYYMEMTRIMMYDIVPYTTSPYRVVLQSVVSGI